MQSRLARLIGFDRLIQVLLGGVLGYESLSFTEVMEIGRRSAEELLVLRGRALEYRNTCACGVARAEAVLGQVEAAQAQIASSSLCPASRQELHEAREAVSSARSKHAAASAEYERSDLLVRMRENEYFMAQLPGLRAAFGLLTRNDHLRPRL